MTKTNPGRGRRNDLPADVTTRDYALGVIRSVCEGYGFEPLDYADASYGKKPDDNIRAVEADLILAINEALERLKINNFAVYLSHTEVLFGILEAVGVPKTLHKHTFGPIRNFSKFNLEGFHTELQDAGVSEKAAATLADLFLNTDEILNQEHDINLTIVSNLLNIVDSETLTELGQILQLTGRKPVFVDPALSSEPPFGPGIVIEARTSGLEILGIGGNIGEYFVFIFDIENIVELMKS